MSPKPFKPQTEGGSPTPQKQPRAQARISTSHAVRQGSLSSGQRSVHVRQAPSHAFAAQMALLVRGMGASR